MNKIKNDYGEWVVAVGAPNSVERMRCKHPKLINRLKYRHDDYNLRLVIAYDLRHQYGFEKWEADLIAEAVEMENQS